MQLSTTTTLGLLIWADSNLYLGNICFQKFGTNQKPSQNYYLLDSGVEHQHIDFIMHACSKMTA